MSDENDHGLCPELIEAIDSLLEEVEQTVESFTPPEEQTIGANTLVADDGTVITASKDSDPETEPESGAKDESPADAGDAPVDSIENAQQALDAIDDIETQAEDLVTQSVDAMLDGTETEDSDPDEQTESAESESLESIAEPDSTVLEIDEDSATDEVDDVVEELVDQEDEVAVDVVDEAQEIVAEEVISEESASTEEDIASEIDDLESCIDGLLEDTEAIINEAEEIEPEQSEVPKAEDGVELDGAPTPIEQAEEPELNEDELIAQPESSSADALDASMDLLDEALSDAADDMLDCDFETEEGDLVSGEAVSSAIEEALNQQDSSEPEIESSDEPANDNDLLDDAIEGLLETEEETQEAPESESTEQTAETDASTEEPAPVEQPLESAASEPTAQESEEKPATTADEALDSAAESEIEELELQAEMCVPAWFERSIEAVRPKIDKIDPLNGKTMDVVAGALGALLVMIITHASPIGAKLLLIVCKPLSKQSPEIRNAVGYIALWTGFLAVVLWIYLLMFRSPGIPTPETAPTRVIDASEPMNPDPVRVLPD